MNLFWAALVYVGGTAALYKSKFGNSTQISRVRRVANPVSVRKIPSRLKRSRSRQPEDIPTKTALV